MFFPSVTIIMPTFNCGPDIEDSLKSIINQDYQGQIKIIIIDGGSTDETLKIAQKYNVEIYINKGQYSGGKNGARRFGETLSKSDLLWYVDSDNIILNQDALSNLVEPFLKNPSINISIPKTEIDPNSNFLNRWMSLKEIYNLNKVIKVSKKEWNYYIIDDLFYGITNCSLIKREVVELAMGWDSDIRLLFRIRKLGLAKAAIVETSFFYHNQINGLSGFLKKWTKRANYFAKMTPKEYEEYFVQYPIPGDLDYNLKQSTMNDIIGVSIISIQNFLKFRNFQWLFGLLYSSIIIISIISHPIISYKLWKKFL